jgi:hypothetical protein
MLAAGETNRVGPKEGLKTFQRPTRWNFAVITSLLRAFRLWTRDRCSTMMVKMAWDRLECWFIIVLPVVRNMEPYSKHLYKQAHHPDHVFKAGDNFFLNSSKDNVTMCIFSNRDWLGWCGRMQQIFDLLIVNLNKCTLDLLQISANPLKQLLPWALSLSLSLCAWVLSTWES